MNKEKILSYLKGFFLPVVTVIVFLLLWQWLSSSLVNSVETDKIELAFKRGGEAEKAKVIECIESNKLLEAKNRALQNNNFFNDKDDRITPINSSCQIVAFPSPGDVTFAAFLIWKDFRVKSEKKNEFNIKYKERNKKREAEGKTPIVYTGTPSFVDQIFTSLTTVFAGVLLAFFLAVPLGIVLGLNENIRDAANLLIQIFKPVSPVVWLLLVSMIITVVAKNADIDKSFVISFISVGLCSMWATLVNTSVGVSTVDVDYINVARVLKLNVFKKIFTVILPASLPMIFTGLRITVSVAWMVLIAIELLAQSPGLGTFVWEEFQNGSSDSNSKIIVAMFVIGFIGFALDRMMLFIQKLITF